MSAPSDYEQLILELVNRARLDPAKEAARLGIDLNKDLAPGEITPDSKQPLAFNGNLNDAAAGHSSWMLANDIFSHTGAGGSDPGERMSAAGYQFTGSWCWGENIAWNGTTGTLDKKLATLTAHDGLFTSAHHRLNILDDSFKEIGVGAETGRFQIYNAFMLTENFARSGSGNFITGVVYADNDGNSFYSLGEGRGGIDIGLEFGGSGIGSTSTWSAGGYGVKTLAAGDVWMTFSGGGLAAPVTAVVGVSGQNVKVDLVGPQRIESSTDTRLGQNAFTLKLLGGDDLDGYGNHAANWIYANSGDNVLAGLNGNDRIYGYAGRDTIYGGDGDDQLYGGSQNDVLQGGRGADYLAGEDGNDWLYGGGWHDTLQGHNGNDRLFGQYGNDVLNGGGGNDVLDGGHGADELAGNWGDDRLYGSAGNDSLWGGYGNDVLNGGDGSDRLTGGADADRFVFTAGQDTITDFTDGVDVLDLRAFHFADFAAVDGLTWQVGSDLVIDPAGWAKLVIEGFELAHFDADDVII